MWETCQVYLLMGQSLAAYRSLLPRREFPTVPLRWTAGRAGTCAAIVRAQPAPATGRPRAHSYCRNLKL